MEENGASSYHRFLNGDRGALEELVEEYSDDLVRFSYLFVRNAAAAEDIMEETFASLIAKRKLFFPRASFKAYLYKIAKNKCIDYLRSRERRIVPLDDAERVLYAEDEEKNLLRKERAKAVYCALNRLPEPYREVLYLAYFEDFSLQELCTATKRSKKQVYNLLARAKKSLKEILKKEGFEYEVL